MNLNLLHSFISTRNTNSYNITCKKINLPQCKFKPINTRIIYGHFAFTDKQVQANSSIEIPPTHIHPYRQRVSTRIYKVE